MIQCNAPVIHFEIIESVDQYFPVDTQRLRTDHDLYRTFERHQKSPQSIQATSEEADQIADIYAMPIATVTLSEQSWDKAMEVMKNNKFKEQRKALIQNWKNRKDDYNHEAKEELVRKIQRHDSHNILLEAMSD
jgi:hypothetical protein